MRKTKTFLQKFNFLFLLTVLFIFATANSNAQTFNETVDYINSKYKHQNGDKSYILVSKTGTIKIHYFGTKKGTYSTYIIENIHDVYITIDSNQERNLLFSCKEGGECVRIERTKVYKRSMHLICFSTSLDTKKVKKAFLHLKDLLEPELF